MLYSCTHVATVDVRGLTDFDFLVACGMEEPTGATTNVLDEDGAEQPRLPEAVMGRRSRPDPELTILEAVSD